MKQSTFIRFHRT